MSPAAKRILWFVVLPALLIGSYSLTGFLLLPRYIQEKTPSFLQNSYGINASIGSVTFNPFTFSLSINDFSIEDQSEKNNTTPLLNIKSIAGALSPLELIRTNLAIKNISIDEPMLSLIRFNENEYNFSRYFSPQQLGNQDEFLNFAQLPFLYSINNIAVNNGEIVFIDKPSDKKHQLTKLNVTLPTLANFDYHTPITLQSNFSAELNGSPLVINSDSINDISGLTMDLNHIELADYVQYLPFDLPVTFHSGTADGKLRFAFGQDKNLTISYQLDIEKLTGETNDQGLHLEIPKSQFIGNYQPMAGTFYLDNVYLKAPFIRGTESLSRSTIDSLLPRQSYDEVSNATTIPLSIHRLLINEGSFEGTHLGDRVAIQNIEFNLQDFNTPINNTANMNPGTFSLKGANKNQGILSWQGSFTDVHSMTGDFQLLHFSSDGLCKLIWNDLLKCSAADSEMKGTFTISRQKETTGTTNIFLSATGSSLNFKSPQISSASTNFKADQLLADNISFDSSQKKIGKLSIKDIDITIADKDIADLVTPFISDKTMQIQAMDITGKASITNQHKQQPLVFNKLFLTTQAAPKDPSNHNINFKAYTGLEGEIRANGTTGLSPLSLTVSVSFDNIGSKELFPLLTSNPVALHSESRLSGKGQYTYPQSGFFGSIESGPAKIFSKGKEIGGWKRAEFSSIIYKSAPYSFRVKETALTEPVFYFDGQPKTKITPDRFAEVFTDLLPVKNLPKNTSRYKYPFYAFDKIEIKNGLLTPLATSPTQSAEYTQISGTIGNVQFPTKGEECQFTFQAKHKGVPLKLSGSGVFFQSPSNGSYSLSFVNPNLESILPQVQDVGLDISKSEIQGQVKAEWFNGKALYNFDLTTGNIVPYDKDSAAALTLALLYKNSPRFTLAFEHKLNNQNENVTLHRIVLEFFKRNQLKTQISPFLLTPDFTDMIDLDTIRFREGSSELTSDAIEWLTRLGVFLQNYPLVKLQLIPSLSAADTAALQKHYELLESQRIEKENEKRYQQWQKENLEISRQREEVAAQNSQEDFIEEDLNAPEIKPFTPLTPKPVVLSVVELNELGYRRLKEVADFLEQSLHVNPAQLERINQVLRNPNTDSGVKLRFSTRFKQPES